MQLAFPQSVSWYFAAKKRLSRRCNPKNEYEVFALNLCRFRILSKFLNEARRLYAVLRSEIDARLRHLTKSDEADLQRFGQLSVNRFTEPATRTAKSRKFIIP